MLAPGGVRIFVATKPVDCMRCFDPTFFVLA